MPSIPIVHWKWSCFFSFTASSMLATRLIHVSPMFNLIAPKAQDFHLPFLATFLVQLGHVLEGKPSKLLVQWIVPQDLFPLSVVICCQLPIVNFQLSIRSQLQSQQTSTCLNTSITCLTWVLAKSFTFSNDNQIDSKLRLTLNLSCQLQSSHITGCKSPSTGSTAGGIEGPADEEGPGPSSAFFTSVSCPNWFFIICIICPIISATTFLANSSSLGWPSLDPLGLEATTTSFSAASESILFFLLFSLFATSSSEQTTTGLGHLFCLSFLLRFESSLDWCNSLNDRLIDGRLSLTRIHPSWQTRCLQKEQ